MDRKNCPVFVMGCHRSGTNLLYDTLLSAGGFAVYRGYLPVYSVLIPRFGSLRRPANRRKLMQTWVRSKGFRRSGLDPGELTAKVLEQCRSGGDFIRITMDEVARRQNAIRWAVYLPDHVLFVRQIKRDIPEALFLHIIRDGRDIALSLRKMGGFRPLPWDRSRRSLAATALYWEWMVRKGREQGLTIPSDYLEVHYEKLVSEPRQTLAQLSQFLDHDLDYERIQRAGLGRVNAPNSSFGQEAVGPQASPVNRWRQKLTRTEIVDIEALVGDCLEETGYPLTTPERERKSGARERLMRAIYFNFLETKLWLKTTTPAGREASLSTLELEEPDFATRNDQTRTTEVLRHREEGREN
jgi:Sulfotransferase family